MPGSPVIRNDTYAGLHPYLAFCAIVTRRNLTRLLPIAAQIARLAELPGLRQIGRVALHIARDVPLGGDGSSSQGNSGVPYDVVVKTRAHARRGLSGDSTEARTGDLINAEVGRGDAGTCSEPGPAPTGVLRRGGLGE